MDNRQNKYSLFQPAILASFKTVAFLAIALSLGCTKSASRSSVQLQLPMKRASSAPILLTKSASSTGVSKWAYAAPTNANEADCYAVFVQAADLAQTSCVNENGAAVTAVSTLYGQYAAGSAISIEVTQGAGRTIGVWAFKSADGSCRTTASLAPSQSSPPLFVGATTIDVNAGTANANIDVSFGGAPKIEQCSGGNVGIWPVPEKCSPQITKLTLVGGHQLRVKGTCLDQTTGLQLRDTATSVTTVMNVLTKSANVITAAVSSNLTMKSGQVYSLIMPSANAQTVTAQLTLVLQPEITLNSGGVVIGKLLTAGNSYLNSFAVRKTNGSIAYYSNSVLNDGSLSLTAQVFAIPPAYAALSQETKDKFLASATLDGYTQYYSGANCTGDRIVPSYNGTSTFLGGYVNYQTCFTAGCPVLVGRVTGSPTYSPSLTVNSSSYGNIQPPATTSCTSNVLTIGGFNIGTPVPVDSSDLPTVPAGWTLTD